MESSPKPPKPDFREGITSLFAFPHRNTRADLKEFITGTLLMGPLFAVIAAIFASALATRLSVIAIYAVAGFLSVVVSEGIGLYLKTSFFWYQLIAGAIFFAALFVTYLFVGSTL